MCTGCKKTKSLACFHKNRAEPDGHQKYCKECRADKKRVPHTHTTYTRVRNGKTQVVTRRVDSHGLSKSDPLYKVWCGMRRRCYETTAKNYRWYGGKGVQVHPDWHDFLTFRQWAYANGYAKGLELDRVDSDGNYEPGNCRWRTKKANLRNRDLVWDDGLDKALVAFAASQDRNPYDVIEEAVRRFLSAEGGDA